jgi:hypothetical protein
MHLDVGVVFIKRRFMLLIILCLLPVLTSFRTWQPTSKKSQVTLLSSKQVIEKFFQYYNKKNYKGMNSLTTQSYHYSKSDKMFDSLVYIKITRITENTNQENKEIYLCCRMRNQLIDMDKEKEKLENVAIYSVSYQVKYKKAGVSLWDSGSYGYNYTLISKDKSSPWLIDAYGY